MDTRKRGTTTGMQVTSIRLEPELKERLRSWLKFSGVVCSACRVSSGMVRVMVCMEYRRFNSGCLARGSDQSRLTALNVNHRVGYWRSLCGSTHRAAQPL